MCDCKKLLKDVLLKKAKGYSYKEKTEEYNVSDGDEILVKKKVVTKHMQPDVAAVKALLSLSESELDVTEMSDEQLQVEKLRLLQMLNLCDETAGSQAESVGEE